MLGLAERRAKAFAGQSNQVSGKLLSDSSIDAAREICEVLDTLLRIAKYDRAQCELSRFSSKPALSYRITSTRIDGDDPSRVVELGALADAAAR